MNTKQQTKLIKVINGASKIVLSIVFIALFTLIIKNA